MYFTSIEVCSLRWKNKRTNYKSKRVESSEAIYSLKLTKWHRIFLKQLQRAYWFVVLQKRNKQGSCFIFLCVCLNLDRSILLVWILKNGTGFPLSLSSYSSPFVSHLPSASFALEPNTKDVGCNRKNCWYSCMKIRQWPDVIPTAQPLQLALVMSFVSLY